MARHKRRKPMSDINRRSLYRRYVSTVDCVYGHSADVDAGR